MPRGACRGEDTELSFRIPTSGIWGGTTQEDISGIREEIGVLGQSAARLGSQATVQARTASPPNAEIADAPPSWSPAMPACPPARSWNHPDAHQQEHHLKLAGRADQFCTEDALNLIHTTACDCPRADCNFAPHSLVAAFAQADQMMKATRRRRGRRIFLKVMDMA